jgi:poly(3-hydroxybutyrate) depolymerase
VAGAKTAGSSGTANEGGGGSEAVAGTAGSSTTPEAGAPSVLGECTSSQKDCAGECVELDDVAYGCTATSCNQSACPAGGETYACEAGACVIATCPTDQKQCDGQCVSVSDPTYGCGPASCDDASCPDPGGGTLVCDGGSCVVGNCSAETKNCGNFCVPFAASNGCAEQGRCTACEANELCAGEPSVCTCEPDDVEACMGKACGPSTNNCGDVIQCPDTCASPSKCGAGQADQNHCGYDVPTGSSAGCNKAPAFGDSASWTLRKVTATGVSAAYIAAHPPYAGQAPYTWTARNYYVRLPANYDKTKAYPVVLGGGGCGNSSGTAGATGGLKTLPTGQDVAIQVGLSYVYGTDQGACFQDDTALTPEVAYLDAVLADVEATYCVDVSKVFAAGYSSGSAEALLFGCARAGTIRGTAHAAGIHRLDRPACADAPVAAMFVVGKDDTAHPIAGPTGSAAARDDILLRNGCSSSQVVPWHALYPNCDLYVDCPKDYPVVWCAIDGGHGTFDPYSSEGMWTFFSSLM